MKIAVPQETVPGERRVALVPASVEAFKKAGHEVLVQANAGLAAGFPNSEYVAAGATMVHGAEELAQAEILLRIRFGGALGLQIGADTFPFHPGQIVIGLCDPVGSPQVIAELAAKRLTIFSLELMPRITRAQSMDVLSSMATIAGYRAVLLAAVNLPRLFPMLMTAAGTIRAAKVFVVGAGVAGLQAIATAKRLGAIVSAYDVRPAVKQQVESLGARFVELPVAISGAEDTRGYAKELAEETLAAQRRLMEEVVAESNVVITTAAVPGKKAPLLITTGMVERMQPGSVIVDVAAERGGNCELTQPGKAIEHRGVLILGPVNLPSDVPFHASQMFSRNITSFLLHVLKKGEIDFNSDDPIIRDTLVVRQGEVVHPEVSKLLSAA